MKILVVFGTRPEAIKMAPVIHALKKEGIFDVQVCVTAQHRELLDQVIRFFGIVPDFDLNVMHARQDLTDITSRILYALRDVFDEAKPDVVLVHGDTTTALAASLAAYYAKIKVAHVEAGLRTEDMYSPWPEEMNRRLIGSLTCIHFAPTDSSKDNLIREGVAPNTIFVTGNTIVEALSSTVTRIDTDEQLKHTLSRQFGFLNKAKRTILVTVHRRENLGDKLEDICIAIRQIALRSDVNIVLPVHLNPSVSQSVQTLLGSSENIYLIAPLDYLSFVFMMKQAYLILTDSGGIQEEAPSLGTPVLVMREETERPEGVDAGACRIVGTDPERIITEAVKLLDDDSEYMTMAKARNPYGDGGASQRICEVLGAGLSLDCRRSST